MRLAAALELGRARRAGVVGVRTLFASARACRGSGCRRMGVGRVSAACNISARLVARMLHALPKPVSVSAISPSQGPLLGCAGKGSRPFLGGVGLWFKCPSHSRFD